MRPYLAILLALGFATAVAAGMTIIAVLLGPKKRTHLKSQPFECGMPPAMPPKQAVSVNFYLTAVLFVLFDIEIIFLYPWAVSFTTLGTKGLLAMGGFIAVLSVALLYAIKRGALAWD